MSPDDGDARQGCGIPEKTRRVVLLAWSLIPDDPRVRRQGDALAAAGWSVMAVGVPGVARGSSPSWPILTEPSTTVNASCRGSDLELRVLDMTESRPSEERAVAPSPVVASQRPRAYTLLRRLWRTLPPRLRARLFPTAIWLLQLRPGGTQIVHKALHRLNQLLLVSPLREVKPVLTLARARLRPDSALKTYWSWPASLQMYAVAKRLRADLWLANDWHTLPIAARLAREIGGRFAYDTHELAFDEYAESIDWRADRRPIVYAIERSFIGDAICVSAVSDGIADHLKHFYRLARRPLVVRNTPPYQAAFFRATGPSVRVLYHGLISPQRSIETTIASVAAWRSEFTLTIRGIGPEGYLESLQNMIAKWRLDHRVALAPPVPMTALVNEAMPFDIGLFVLEERNLHYRYALPNKVFEYVMAGLALCISQLPDMTRLIRKYGLGVTVRAPTPDAIAEAINSLDREAIDTFKKNALSAAHELCWEREAARLVEAYRSAI